MFTTIANYVKNKLLDYKYGRLYPHHKCDVCGTTGQLRVRRRGDYGRYCAIRCMHCGFCSSISDCQNCFLLNEDSGTDLGI